MKTKITAVKGKAAVYVVNWGQAPFAIENTKRGLAYIPDGFIVEAKSDSHYWIAETRVSVACQAEYRFTLRDNPSVRSEWRTNPTAAYKDANTKQGNLKFASGSNGRLIIGVTYENLQAEITKRFGTEIRKLGLPEPSSPDSVENIRPFPTGASPMLESKKIATRPVRSTSTSDGKASKRMKIEDAAPLLPQELEVQRILLSLRHGLCDTTNVFRPVSTISDFGFGVSHASCEGIVS